VRDLTTKGRPVPGVRFTVRNPSTVGFGTGALRHGRLWSLQSSPLVLIGKPNAVVVPMVMVLAMTRPSSNPPL
jgi:hypothetical protein